MENPLLYMNFTKCKSLKKNHLFRKRKTELKILVTLLCQGVAKITSPRILCLDMCLCFFLRASMMV